MKLPNPPGAQFEILIDGKPPSYRDLRAVAIEFSRISQAPQPARRGRSERPAEWRDPRRHPQAGVKDPMPQKRRYKPRVFEGRVIESDEIERIHKQVLEFERAGWP